MNTRLLTTKQCAEQLGVSVLRVRQFIALGRLKAEKYGCNWLVQPYSLQELLLERIEKGIKTNVEHKRENDKRRSSAS